MPDKKWTAAEIEKKLLENDYWVARAVVALYNRQEADEQEGGYTRKKNMMGFNAIHAEFLTSLAKQYIKKGFLSKKQIETARKYVPTYKKQLARIANGE